MIGSLGNLVFNASANQFKTFKDMSKSSSTRYGTHETIDGKPRLEFTGENLDTISFRLFWRIEDKVNPMTAIEPLQKARKEGEILPFLLGGKKIGNYVITSIGEGDLRIDNRGNVLAAEFNVSMSEYVMDEEEVDENLEDERKVEKNAEEITKETTVVTVHVDDEYFMESLLK